MDDTSPSCEAIHSFTPRYNIAPTQSVACVVRYAVGEPRQLDLFRWGLVPSWADDLAIGSRMINARSETVAEKPSFRKAFVTRRCLVISDGYYEWKTDGKAKQPYLIEHADGEVFAMAGLWEENRKAAKSTESNEAISIKTCTILTTSGNDFTRDIHDRMPVILSEKDYDRWLDPANHDTESLQSLLASAPNEFLRRTPVSKRVGSVRNVDAKCAEPIGETETWR
jgi:putative SOS response-associated peptidase YedK